MKHLKKPTASLFVQACLSTLLLLPAVNALAASGGGGGGSGGGGGGLNVKVEPFTVNLLDMTRYFRVGLTLQVADAKVGEAIKLVMPIVRHEMILLLSSQNADQLSTAEGKKSLAHDILTAINKLIKRKDQEGVTDIFYESFIIQ